MCPLGIYDWKENWQIVDHLKDLQQLLDHVKVKKFYVIGVSAGAAPAMAVAAR